MELDEAMRVTNRRVNALDNVVIPKLENTMHYIASELDEREREDLFRLKKVVAKKKKEAIIADAARRADENKRDKAAAIMSAREQAPDVMEYEDPDENVADIF